MVGIPIFPRRRNWPSSSSGVRSATRATSRANAQRALRTPLEDDGQFLRLGKIGIPTIGEAWQLKVPGVESESPRFLEINYRGQLQAEETPPPFLAFSVIDLLEGRTRDQLRGKVLLMGFSSTEIGDRLPTPVSGRIPMPGVEIHAN